MPTSPHWEVTNLLWISVKSVHSEEPMWASTPTSVLRDFRNFVNVRKYGRR